MSFKKKKFKKRENGGALFQAWRVCEKLHFWPRYWKVWESHDNDQCIICKRKRNEWPNCAWCKENAKFIDLVRSVSSAVCGKTYHPSKHACAIHIFHQPRSSSLVWEWENVYILGGKQILRWKILSWLNISCGCQGESVLLAQHLGTLGKNLVQRPRFWSNWYYFCLWCLPWRSICISITAYSGQRSWSD